MVADEYWPILPRPEETGMTVVHLTDRHLGWIEPRHHPRVDDENEAVRCHRYVGSASTGLASMEGEGAIRPEIALRGVWRGPHQKLCLVRRVVVAPKRTVAPTERAVAVEHPFWRLSKLEADGSAVTGCADHLNGPFFFLRHWKPTTLNGDPTAQAEALFMRSAKTPARAVRPQWPGTSPSRADQWPARQSRNRRNWSGRRGLHPGSRSRLHRGRSASGT